MVFRNRVKIIRAPAPSIRAVKVNCSAPIDMPRQTLHRMNESVKGSFTAVRNLITDKAPTKPRDKASEDLTTAMSALTLKRTMARVLPNPLGEEYVNVKFKYSFLTMNPQTSATKIMTLPWAKVTDIDSDNWASGKFNVESKYTSEP